MSASENKKEILVVSFGTSVKSARERSLDKIEAAVRGAYPEYIVDKCFTSKFVRGKIEREEGLHILSPEEAIEKAIADGVRELYALPTHLMDGIELRAFRELLDTYRDRFDICTCAGPMAETEEDRQKLIEAVAARVHGIAGKKTGVVLVGHGTKDAANDLYGTLQAELGKSGYANYAVGTIEAKPDYEDVVHFLKEKGVWEAVLLPFLVVAGDHALNDIGGENEDSWQSRLQAEGFAVTTLTEGLGELEGVHKLLTAHVGKMIEEK